MSENVAVHVIDDDTAVRHSLEFLFQSAGVPVRTYASAIAFLDVVAKSQVGGCILTDIRMPDLDGLALQRKLIELTIKLPVIFITGHGDVPIAVEAFRAGAVDFIEKPFDDERLLTAVGDALELSRCTKVQGAEMESIAIRLARLTPREREMLDGLVAGQPNKMIAHDLGLSPRTVEVHRARVMEKMDARSLSDLLRMALTVNPVSGPLRTSNERM